VRCDLGSEEIFNQFNRLEEKIETLINKCVVLDKENSDLKIKISELEELIRLNKDSEMEKAIEAEELKLKIDKIIERISDYSSQGI